MKLAALLATAVLPAGMMAVPIAEGDNQVSKRTDTSCAIVNASKVNCRTGPGTQYRVVATLNKGIVGVYSCVKSGECITVSGSVNW